MNSLLKRQIAKHLDTGLNNIDLFFKAVDNSYENYEEQIAMLQRAMKISSDELYAANQKLREESESLKDINRNLESILNSMNLEVDKFSNTNKLKSSEYIKQQAAEIIKINKQREELLVNLEKQNQALNEYAHMVSHDLKAPLRSIDTLINWFMEDNAEMMTEENKKSMHTILSNVEKMDSLIKGILVYSSVEKQEVEDRVIDLNILIDEVVRTIHVPEHITLKINNTLPKVFGNQFRFNQLFQNLIQNAIKYNDKSAGIIEIGSSETETEMQFYIKDNGIGIAAQHQNKIFDVFSKLHSNDPSSGIGLSIVKKIIDIYHGKIWLESQENVGTTFYFTFPKN
ncbi:GHKL domain-containing protein [Flavobacterium sp. CYK-4]|uniref:sensor histidine kinase n=1 Tax=Flavobacterium lotistagni TaxID=2709660 RepID=UPI001409BE16|nr:ATP-binding protein [Flavobacterium lotistagni]NHM07422.1 GHKL domain-containing protein [Flavobacterium lotistagni]